MEINKQLFRSFFSSRYFVFTSFALILFMLFLRITYYPQLIFDEHYYVVSAKAIYSQKNDINFEHPLLAKWLIGLPFVFMSQDFSLSWRLVPVAFGFGGLLLIYLLGRMNKLTRFQAVVCTFALLLSGTWYILSRIAMLDIFVSTFILMHSFSLFVFLKRNNFSRYFFDTTSRQYYYLSIFLLALAMSSKWTGFFPLLIYIGLFLFYYKDAIHRLLLQLFLVFVVWFSLYSAINLAILRFNFNDFLFRNLNSVVYHTQNNRVEDAQKKFPQERYIYTSSYKAMVRFFFHYEIIYVDNLQMPANLLKIGLSNNYLVPLSYLIFSMIFLLCLVAVLIRRAQRVAMDLPVIFAHPELMFFFAYASVLIIPWFFVLRIHYLFYYLPAFPYIILFTAIYLFRFCNWKLQLFYYALYFGFALYWVRIWIPM